MKSIVLKKRWFKSTTKFTKRQKQKFLDLLQNPQNCEVLDRKKNNILHLAVICNEVELLKKGMHLKKLLKLKNDWGFTPLELARLLGRNECVEVISPRKEIIIKLIKNGITYFFSEKEYTKFTKVKYIPELRFDDITVLESVVKKCKRAFKKNEITEKHKWRGAYYGKDIETNNLAPVRIEWVNRMMGYGLFADKPIKKGAFIAEYAGHLRKFSSRKDDKNSYCFEYLIADKFDTPFVIDAKSEGNLARYINHDDDGNLSPIAIYHQGIMRVVLKADRDIKKDEQLCYDYGPDYWAKREEPAEL